MAEGFSRPRVVVSKCIEFEHCRYNGQIIASPSVRLMKPHVEFVPVCPEVEIGLGVPRDPIRVIERGGERSLYQPATGRDLTSRMVSFAERYLDGLDVVDGFILKSRSPSCGIKDVKIHAGPEKGPAAGKGTGFFGDAVLRRYPELPVEDEGRITNFTLREHLLTRLFVLASFRACRGRGAVRDLVRFQATNKFLLMAYNQKELRLLGRIVANPVKRPAAELFDEYGRHLRAALSRPARFTSNINVMMHGLGYFSKSLTAREKAHFLDMMEQYRSGKVPLGVCLGILGSWIARFGEEYLADQTFFRPYPLELVEITDSGKGRKI